MEQRLRHWANNPGVRGSSPIEGNIFSERYLEKRRERDDGGIVKEGRHENMIF